MKKKILIISTILIISVFCICFVSCQRCIDKPEDTNLELWLGERYTEDELKELGYELVSPGFGCDTYASSKYNIERDLDGNGSLNGEYVKYERSGYPDATSEYAITSITITDPEVNIFGLTINSSQEEVEKVLKKQKFKKKDKDFTRKVYNIETRAWEEEVYYVEHYYTKNKVTFVLKDYPGADKQIFIAVGTTNLMGVIF